MKGLKINRIKFSYKDGLSHQPTCIITDLIHYAGSDRHIVIYLYKNKISIKKCNDNLIKISDYFKNIPLEKREYKLKRLKFNLEKSRSVITKFNL